MSVGLLRGCIDRLETFANGGENDKPSQVYLPGLRLAIQRLKRDLVLEEERLAGALADLRRHSFGGEDDGA